ncbi:amino acid adenylation domain-containing protein [Vibrio mangrovi]|uniref:Amino acid adenylation domain-containing protein n=1 Tax=Vibrio mangrovi TaxID=474394 RepID=A0A1Y6IYH1_9VIBR|nr:amino acid adenylation domain-containing protein [Vibrio mangrovi]MDW6002415.1 amino acid adenylation domain-containing protein [Vibrio mangrovi]SMS02688.1 Linear gramicidin synthase subunit D [Vibrio mangrovi]
MTQTVFHGFLRQCSLTPYHTALFDQHRQMTYQELDQASDHLAGVLQQQGVIPGDNIPIIACRSVELVIGILAIIKTGAAYIPVDASYPERRITMITRQSRSPLVLTTHQELNFLIPYMDKTVIAIDTLNQYPQHYPQYVDVQEQSVAYIIFTSGTTGEPKGVMISHASLYNLLDWHNHRFEMSPKSRTSLNAGIGFDVAQWEIWSTLICGATLCIPHENTRRDPRELLGFFADHQLTHAFVPTVMVAEITSIPQPLHLALDYLFTAGEKLHPVNLTQITYQLIDYYGPTETTIFTTCNSVGCCSRNPPDTIGRPVAGAQIWILDEQQQPVKMGESGELYIAGPGVALGYLDAPDLSREKFVSLPHLTGKKLFRSGDRAQWLPNGMVQYLGRFDDQIKIRGNRIELTELTHIILQLPSVRNATSIVTENHHLADKKILSFIVLNKQDQTPEMQSDVIQEIRQHIHLSLPDYFQPAEIVPLQSLPINPNGKIDKPALLAAYQNYRKLIQQKTSIFMTEQEQQLATIWCSLLDRPSVTPEDTFFDAGGNSLMAVRLTTLITQKLGIRAYVRDIYDYPTLGQQAKVFAKRAGYQQPDVDHEPVYALHEDIRLPENWQPTFHFDTQQLHAPNTIFLTGTTGFIGAHLLAELLRTTHAQICCLVRAQSQEHAGQRILQTLCRYKIKLPEEALIRIQPLYGDLAEPNFALPPAIYVALSQQVDLIYHSASSVNFIQPYSYMKRDNVQGLQEILRFAVHQRTKPLILLSTISVYSWGHLHTGKHVMHEDDDIDQNLPAVITDIGYVRSKWVMEKIADLAASKGLPLMTFRLGYATCHSQTGVSADYQWWGRLVKTCLEHKTIPDLRQLREGLTTVDYMTQAIAYISRNPNALGLKFNLIHAQQNNLTLKTFFRLLAQQFDLTFQTIPFHDWLTQWENNPEAPLYPLLSLFKDKMVDDQSTVQLYQDTYRWDCSHVKRFLQGSGIEEPQFTREVLQRYLEESIGYHPIQV